MWWRVRSKKKIFLRLGRQKKSYNCTFFSSASYSSKRERVWLEKLLVRVGVRFRFEIRKLCGCGCGCSSKLIIGAVVGAGEVRKFMLVRLRLQVGYTSKLCFDEAAGADGVEN